MRDYVILVSLDDQACSAMARRLRAEHVYCRIMPATVSADEILQEDPKGVVLACGVTGYPAAVPHMMDLLQTGLPMLCMGDAALTLCQTLGGELSGEVAEDCVVQMQADASDPLFAGIGDTERFFAACRYMGLPQEQGSPVVTGEGGMLGFRVRQRDVWALAFPLERNDPDSTQLLINFCRDVCGCSLWWSHQAFVEKAKAAICEAAGDGMALCALSGGVDSGVCALLGHDALRDRLQCLFVDTGFLRKDESDQVLDFYQQQMGLKVRRIDASEEFLAALEGVVIPAEKDRIIVQLLQALVDREADAIPNASLILQGTNYTDIMNAPADSTPLAPHRLRIIEPVRELFKDEIRQVGEELGMPAAMTQRQPFPGSGLASRIYGTVTRDKLAILREADALFRSEIAASGQHKRLWQYFAALADSPTPGEGCIITLRAVQSVDGASAMAARLPSDLLERVTMDILTHCPDVRRVMYDLTPSRRYTHPDAH